MVVTNPRHTVGILPWLQNRTSERNTSSKLESKLYNQVGARYDMIGKDNRTEVALAIFVGIVAGRYTNHSLVASKGYVKDAFKMADEFIAEAQASQPDTPPTPIGIDYI